MRRRWPLALVAALAAAEAAVLLLRPRGILPPVDVSPRDFFTPAQLRKAQDFERPQIALYGSQLALQAGALAILAARPPKRLLHARRPLVAGAATGAAIQVMLTVVTLPVAAIGHHRAVDVGLSTQGWGSWLGDVGRSLGVGIVLGALGGLLALAVIRRFPERWWIPGAALAVVISAFFLWVGPVLLDPIFNRFTPLAPGPLRSEIMHIADRAHVQVGQVFVVDASRRTTGLNAYVTGLGRTKRVVLYDTLLHGPTRAETRSVIAHELGHVRHHDVPRWLLYILIVAPFAAWAIFALTRRLARDPVGPAVLPALVLALGVVTTPVTWISNALSRRVEARADQFALQVTDDPRAAIALERRLSVSNVADPDPPGWTRFLDTHPAAIQRIGQAVAWERGKR